MALSASSLASDIKASYLSFSGVDSDGSPIFSGDNKSPNPPPESNNFPADFASKYNNYGKSGVVLGAINNGGNTSGLSSVLGSINNSPAFIPAFAAALVTYWGSTALINGAPAHGGVAVESVTNNAGSKQSAFEGAISISYTQNRSEPFYQVFIQNIENVVKSIEWTITEKMPDGSSKEFKENIS